MEQTSIIKIMTAMRMTLIIIIMIFQTLVIEIYNNSKNMK